MNISATTVVKGCGQIWMAYRATIASRVSSNLMRKYQHLVESVLKNGQFKENRTGVDTISNFGESYKINLQQGFPLLTTKKMDGFRWDSLIHEILWYFSGEEHIDNLTEETSIWDEWADENNRLETAYGRFWRRYPVPDTLEGLAGENWERDDYVTREERPGGESQLVMDQIEYILDTLRNNPNSRRMVLNAWHPGNACSSTLPPCHYSSVFNVQNRNGEQYLNCHLSQRSADIALGVPFNIAAYSIITKILAQRADMKVGKFHHTLVDAHIYCGNGERSDWYRNNISDLRGEVTIRNGQAYDDFSEILENRLPDDEGNSDHIPGLLTQISRDTMTRPTLEIEDKPIDELEFDDFELKDYQSHDGIRFGVAE